MSFLTSNMGLIAWDLGDDPYDHSQLANNWTAVDTHDHTPGKGKLIPTQGIQDAAVTTAKIADGAVTPAKIPNDSITSTQLATNAVGTVEIQDASITKPKLAAGIITGDIIEPQFLPIGTVIAWYRPNTGVAFPSGGWEVCDGRSWSLITNVWGVSTGNIPDLSNKFILGAGTTNLGTGASQNPDIGTVGVVTHTTSLAHSHTVNSHSHTVNSHAHVINSDGSHSHDYSAGGGAVDPPAPITADSMQSNANRGNDNYATGTPGVAEAFAYKAHTHYGRTAANGSHSHGGTTAATSGTTDAQTPGTDSQLGTLDKRPAYVGLLYIMKVRY
jgi:hypothetical protein